MGHDLGSQLLERFAPALDEDVCVAGFIYCGEGDEDDLGVGDLSKGQL